LLPLSLVADPSLPVPALYLRYLSRLSALIRVFCARYLDFVGSNKKGRKDAAKIKLFHGARASVISPNFSVGGRWTMGRRVAPEAHASVAASPQSGFPAMLVRTKAPLNELPVFPGGEDRFRRRRAPA
jgi:hypothetical protein